MLPSLLRESIRSNNHTSTTSGYCPGYTQCNLITLPAEFADQFENFCHLNKSSCPLLERLPMNETSSKMAVNSDLRTDLPQYLFYSKDSKDAVSLCHIHPPEPFVMFLIGCSFSFEDILINNSIPLRHVDQQRTIPMYRTNIRCKASFPFDGDMVVSMRPIPSDLVSLAYQLTAPLTKVHGPPIHSGSPTDIGISDINLPDWGDPVLFEDCDVPVFWPCGVTSQNAVIHALKHIDWAYTHSPGCMFVSNIKTVDLFSESC